MSLDTQKYDAALKQALADLEQLLQQKGKIDAEIANLRSLIAATQAMLKVRDNAPTKLEIPSGLSDLGITEAVREVLRGAKNPSSVGDVRAVLQTLRFPIEEYKDPAVVIGTVLDRLISGGEVDRIESVGGFPTSYKWVRPVSKSPVP